MGPSSTGRHKFEIAKMRNKIIKYGWFLKNALHYSICWQIVGHWVSFIVSIYPASGHIKTFNHPFLQLEMISKLIEPDSKFISIHRYLYHFISISNIDKIFICMSFELTSIIRGWGHLYSWRARVWFWLWILKVKWPTQNLYFLMLGWHW